MTSTTTESPPNGIVRLKSLFELDKLVHSLIKDLGDTGVIETMGEALGCYENYKKEVKKSPNTDYEMAYIYFQSANSIATKRIPTLPDWPRYLESEKAKEDGVVSIYHTLCESIANDNNIASIREYIYEHSNPPSAFDFKHNGTIDVRQMKALLDRNDDKIMLIDFRARDEFKKNHIRSKNVICIEPISVRSNYRDVEIEEQSLITSPDHEKELFSRRNTFELLIIYSETSGSAIIGDLDKLYTILTRRAFDKPLKRSPVVLSGGISAWISTFGLSNFGHNHGDLSMPGRLPTRRPSQSDRGSVGIVRSFNEYLSNPTKTDFKLFNGRQQLPRQHQPVPYQEPHHSLRPTYSPVPTQQHQKAPLQRRSNSLKFPSLSASKILSPSKTNEQPKTLVPIPSVADVSSQTWRPSTPFSTSVANQPRTFTPQPGLVSSSTSSGSVDIARFHCTTGLCNLGNSCYMNCIIQCLLGTIPLTRLFFDGTYKNHVNINSRLGSKGIMARFFADLTLSSLRNSDSIYEPRNFKSAVGSINATFRNNDQQDCSEFLNFVLDGLHEDLNECGNKLRAPPPTEEEEKLLELMPIRLASTIEWERYLVSDFSAIVYFFQGQYASQLKCMECGTTSTTYQSFSVLSLPIPEQYATTRYDKIPLEKCFDEFTKLEVLDGDNRWNCSHCKQLRKATKKITITRLPMNLIVHLKRFRSGASYQKVTSFVEYPFELSLTKYWPQISSADEAEKLSHYPSRGQTPPFNYNLYAVANHSGTLGSGHYTAFVWKGVQKRWCHFDDTKVSKNVQKNAVVNANAYVLFYGRSH